MLFSLLLLSDRRPPCLSAPSRWRGLFFQPSSARAGGGFSVGSDRKPGPTAFATPKRSGAERSEVGLQRQGRFRQKGTNGGEASASDEVGDFSRGGGPGESFPWWVEGKAPWVRRLRRGQSPCLSRRFAAYVFPEGEAPARRLPPPRKASARKPSPYPNPAFLPSFGDLPFRRYPPKAAYLIRWRAVCASQTGCQRMNRRRPPKGPHRL